MEFKEIQPYDLSQNVFEQIGKKWMLIMAEKDGAVNAMTASWGALGVIWGKNVAFVFIRPQRYTKEFVDSADCFSLSFLNESYREHLNYFGKVSGRDEDKIAKSGLSIAKTDGVAYFAESETVIICRKMLAQPLDPECFILPAEIGKNYSAKDYHTIYIGEILKVLEK